jgi:3-oxoacyl-[acyl-carrier protein] reductase
MISKMASKIFMKNKEGPLVNISSVVGEVGNPMQCIYSTTKAGLIGLTKSLAKEICMMTKNDKVRINAVAPGFIQSKMTESIPEEFAVKMKENIPLARVGTAKEVSSVVCFLLSEEASYVTGTVFDVNGGML